MEITKENVLGLIPPIPDHRPPHQGNMHLTLMNGGNSKQCLNSPEKVRYLPSEIQICKTGGKRTASAMCSFQRKPQIDKSKDAMSHRSVSECEDVFNRNPDDLKIKQISASTAPKPVAYSDIGLDFQQNMDDVMSTVSDVSDLSVMSLNSSYLGIGGAFRNHKQLTVRNKSRFKKTEVIKENVIQLSNDSSSEGKGTCHSNIDIPVGVHGNWSSFQQKTDFHARVQIKKLNKELEAVKKENEEYAKQAKYFAKNIHDENHPKKEMLKQAREDFGIIRENANLKSQLESLQTRIECFKQLTNLQTLQTVNTSIKDNVEGMIENEDTKKRLDDNASLHMQEWTDTKDENVRLKTELMKYGLEIKRFEEEKVLLKEKCSKLENTISRDEGRLKDFEGKVTILNRERATLISSKTGLEHTFKQLQVECNSHISNRDLYLRQFNEAKDNLTYLQRQLMLERKAATDIKVKLSLKDQEIGVLKVKNEEQMRSALKDKANLVGKLEELNIELKDREVATAVQEDNLQKTSPLPTPPPSPEKVSQLLEKLKKYETEMSEMSTEVSKTKLIQSQLDISKEEITHLKEREQTLKTSSFILEENVLLLETQVEDTSTKLLEAERQSSQEKATMLRMKEEWNEKMKMLQQAHETNVQNEILIGSLQSDVAAAREKEHENLKEFAMLTVSVNKANTESNLKSEELENTKHRLDHLNAEIISTRSQLEDLESVKDENLTLKKSLMTLENEKKNWGYKIEELRLEKESDSAQLQHPMNEKLQELELLLESRDRKINFLQEEHKQEVKRASHAEETTSICRNQIESLQKEMLALKENKNSKESSNGKDCDSNTEDEGIQSEIDSQKVVRLECTVAVLEAEVSHLSSTITQLEINTIQLEQDNGRLLAESLTNAALQSQVVQLQEDIAKDTKLRKELFDRLNHAKADLAQELTKLDRCLKDEKASHALTMEKLLLQEHESKQLRVERHSLKVGFEAANMTLDRMENEAVTLKQQLKEQKEHGAFRNEDINDSRIGNQIDQEVRQDGSCTTSVERFNRTPIKLLFKLKEDELSRKNLEAKEIASQLYDDKQTIAILEDRLRDLNFNLHQKNTELASIKTMAAVRSDGQDREVVELNEKCTNYRKDLETAAGRLASVAEERNSYRNQVHEMNIALKNSLDHIKRLRAKAAKSSSGRQSTSLSRCTSPKSIGSSTEASVDENEADLSEILQRTTTPAGKNLSHLQNCLASLKSEMAVLQSRLASSSGSTAMYQEEQPSLIPQQYTE